MSPPPSFPPNTQVVTPGFQKWGGSLCRGGGGGGEGRGMPCMGHPVLVSPLIAEQMTPPKMRKNDIIQGGPEKKQNGILPTICGCNNWYQCMR